MQLSWAEDTKNPNCWTVVYKWTIVSHLKSSFIDFYIFCFWFMFIHLSSSHQIKHNRLASRACVYPFCVSLSVSVCVSLIITRGGRLQENRGVRLRRGLCEADRLGSLVSLWRSWKALMGSQPTKRCGSQYTISVREPKSVVWVFSLGLKCRCEQNERHTRSCSDYKATKRETGAESVSVPTTESTKSIWTDPLRPSLWPQMEIWWKMWTVKRALVKRACRSSRESWERLGIVFRLRQGHCEMTRKD